MNKKLASIAEDTLNIIKNKNVKNVDISKDIDYCIRKSILLKPNETCKFEEKEIDSIIEVTNETSLFAAKRSIDEGNKTIILNFASGVCPGGGFLHGMPAQEESLVRVSALYPCIKQFNEMYLYNKKLGSGLYSDYMIYSPDVPIFKNDNGTIVDMYKCSFITSPAVDKRRITKEHLKNANITMENRIYKILSLAASKNYDSIILGAFGCGVFKNNPKEVASIFKKVLNENKFGFKKIIFAIYDKNPNSFNVVTFRNILRK